MGIQVDKCMDCWVGELVGWWVDNGLINEWMDGWMKGVSWWVDRWVENGGMDGWMGEGGGS